MNTKPTFLTTLFSLFMIALIFFIGFNGKRNYDVPNQLYQVYMDGEVIGVIEEKDDLLNMINEKQSSIKKKYKVDEVHVPNGLEIKSIVTYDGRINTISEIYDKITALKDFTVKGYEINVVKSDDDGNQVGEPLKIYVLDKKCFENAIDNLVETFVNEETYQKYLDGKQEEIVDVGTYVEDITLGQEVTIKPSYISINETIYDDVTDLTRYLLFGENLNKKSYKIKSGDTIEKVAAKNKLSVDEFIIANPELKSKDVLLFAGQKVNISLISPLIDVVVVSERTEIQDVPYKTSIKYDYDVSPDTNYVKQKGVKGKSKVTFKVETINGQDGNVVKTNTVVLSAPTTKIVIRGYGVGSGYIYTDSDWGWPTNAGYTITSDVGYRWGSYHNGLDIAGTGYGSTIYAAADGVVYDAGYYAADMGNYVMIDHQNGYFSRYFHLAYTSVTTGQKVKKGQKIGAMGNTGYVVPAPSKKYPFAGTHLHFEVWVGGKPWQGGKVINPLTLYK